MKNKIHIIGIASGGTVNLTPQNLQLINRAEMVFGGKRLLDMFSSITGEKIIVKNNLPQVTAAIKEKLGHKRIVVLASGDPDFYGIASHLVRELGKKAVEISPNVSAVQLAFARIKESWEDAAFISLHSRATDNLLETVRANAKICILTDSTNNPAKIARLLLDNGIKNYRAYICQNMGDKSEKVISIGLRRLSAMECAPLNILILIRSAPLATNEVPQTRLPGISDDEFYQRKPKAGLITKQEVRAVSLAKMRLTKESVIWDIGAGSGAISIEASFLVSKGHIYAVEKNSADVAIIKKNIKKFGVHNIEVVHTFAPEGLDGLPAPTTVFIGGSGGNIETIVDYVSRKLMPGGQIVINVVALENLNSALKMLNLRGFNTDITQVSIARSVNTRELTRFEALNSVFIISAIAKNQGA